MRLYPILPLLFSMLLFACHKPVSTSAPKRPNIIFIMTDDHSRQAVSAYSNKLLQTPNIDKLAQEGLLFKNAFVTNSICGPARAVVLTGKFSHKNGFRDNFDTFDGSQPTVPKYLSSAGYYTAIVGKWHLKSVPQGFNEYSVLIDQGEYWNPRFFGGKDTVVEEGYATNLITDKAIKVLEQQKNSGKPIFLMVHQKAPHRNWMPDTTHLKQGEKWYEIPETFFDDYSGRSSAATMQDMRIENMFLGYDLKLYLKGKQSEETGTGGEKTKNPYSWWEHINQRFTPAQREAWNRYYYPISEAYYKDKLIGNELLKWKYNRYMNDYLKCIQSVDDNIGRLMQYLKDNGMEENTLVIYTSDQGFFLGEHGWYDKRFMYEPSLAIPLVMKYPSKIKPGSVNDNLVQNLDLAPTMLAAAGVKVPVDMQGMPLNGLFAGQVKAKWRDKLYYHFYENKGSHSVQKHIGIRTDRYKLIYFYDIRQWELYDLQKDPNEMKNLYHNGEYKKLSEDLKNQLKELIRSYDDTLPDGI